MVMNTLFLQNLCFYEFALYRTDGIPLRSMPLKPHEWPFKILRLQAYGVGTFQVRNLSFTSENQRNALRQDFLLLIESKNRMLIKYGHAQPP